MVSIRQIAREAGVSSSTVFRVLHDKSAVVPAKRERVLAVAKRLNYRPLIRQPEKPTAQTKFIGCLVTQLGTLHEGTVVAKLAEHLNELGYGLLIKESLSRPIRTTEALRFFLKQNVEGITIHSGHGTTPIPAELLQQIKQRDIPLITYDVTPTELPCDWVGFDEPAIGEMAVRYLADLGHQRIGYLGAFLRGFSYGRPQAMQQAFQRHQLSTEYFVGVDESNCTLALATMLQSTQRPTAIITERVDFAPMVLRVMQHLGLHVPSHVSILAVGSAQTARELLPSIPCIAIPEQELAERTARLLLQRITRDPALGDAPIRLPIKPHMVEQPHTTEHTP